MQPSTWLFAPGPVYCARLHQLDKRGRCLVTIDTRWMDVDKLLQPIPKNTEELRQRAVQDVAQVETSAHLTEERAKGVWAPLAALPDTAFYLYIPVGYGGEAKKLCKKLGIRVHGYRTWRYIPQGIEINDISEPPDVMVPLMP